MYCGEELLDRVIVKEYIHKSFSKAQKSARKNKSQMKNKLLIVRPTRVGLAVRLHLNTYVHNIQ